MNREMPIERLALLPLSVLPRHIPSVWERLQRSVVLEAIPTTIYQFRSDRNAWYQSRSHNSTYWHERRDDAKSQAQRIGMFNQGTSRDCNSRPAIALRTDSCFIVVSKYPSKSILEHKYTPSCPPLACRILNCLEQTEGIELYFTLRGYFKNSGRDQLDADLSQVMETFEGSLKRPFFGTVMGEPDGSLGVLVSNVIPGSRAANAGIHPGDRIIRASTWDGKSGQELDNSSEILRVLYDLNSNLSSVTVRVDFDEVTVLAYG